MEYTVKRRIFKKNEQKEAEIQKRQGVYITVTI